MPRLVTAVVLGQFVGLLGWIDPLFIPFALAAPPITGALAARHGLPVVWIAVLWVSAGVNMLWTDWLVNREDVAFHAVVAVVMAVLASAGWSLMHLASRRRTGEVAR